MVGRRLSALVELWERNSLVTDGFSSQRDSNTELCRFCISLSIVLNKHSCCIAMNWTYTNTLRAQTTWWPFRRQHFRMYFSPWVKMCMIWFYIQCNDFAYIRMNGITNIEDAVISGIVTLSCISDMTVLVHLIYRIEEICPPRADGCCGMRVVA